MLISLSLSNWKSHLSSSFKFGKGTSVLLGRMGSGKSSVLDAICFALYGTFPKMQRRDQSLSDLISMASKAEVASVELEFEAHGKHYAVLRRIGERTHEAEVRLEGRLVQKGAKAASDYVAGVLGVDYELFTRAIYSEQNRIDYLLSLNPRQRKTEIDWLLGLGQFDEARESAQNAHYRLSEKAQELSSPSDSERLAQLEKELAERLRSLEEKKAEQQRLIAQKAEAERFVAQKEEGLGVLEKQREAYGKKKSECERLQGAIVGLEKEVSGKSKPSEEDICRLEKENEEAEKLVFKARLRLKEISASISAVKSEIAVLENGRKLAAQRAKKAQQISRQLASLLEGKGKEEMEAKLRTLAGRLDSLLAERARLSEEQKAISASLEALSSASANCPVCGSELAPEKKEKIAAEKKRMLSQNKERLGQAEEEAAKQRKALEACQKALYEAALLTSELEKLSAEGVDEAPYLQEIAKKEKQVKKLEEEFSAAEAEAEALDAKVKKARKSLDELVAQKRLFDSLEATISKYAQAASELSAMGFSEEAYERARKEAEQARLESSRLFSELSSVSSQVKLLDELCASARKEADRINERKRIAEGYARAAESMAIYKNALAAAQSELRASLVEEINSALREIWPSIYPYSDYGGVMLSADEKDYRFIMEKGGQWKDVDAVASGGERACFCLSLRIAFAAVLTPDIGILILDEPTHNLDSEAVGMLSEAISRKIPSVVEQTIVITHDSALAENVEGTVYLLLCDKNKNRWTEVQLQR
ncbi:MAG: hypothetical protein N3E51_00995 [Candidatus Micrarchaeota archaeon]|nr:hypothetical protein [Candidatus Micrarchaeota archaeon]